MGEIKLVAAGPTGYAGGDLVDHQQPCAKENRIRVIPPPAVVLTQEQVDQQWKGRKASQNFQYVNPKSRYGKPPVPPRIVLAPLEKKDGAQDF